MRLYRISKSPDTWKALRKCQCVCVTVCVYQVMFTAVNLYKQASLVFPRPDLGMPG